MVILDVDCQIANEVCMNVIRILICFVWSMPISVYVNIRFLLCSTYAFVNSLQSSVTLVKFLIESEYGAIFLKLYRYVKFSSNCDNFIYWRKLKKKCSSIHIRDR